MEFLDFSNLVMQRQSCRSFAKKEISSDVLEKILNLARFAPSACNSQPWKMYCVSNTAIREKVANALQEGGRNLFVSNASAFIVLCETTGITNASVLERFASKHFVQYDIGQLTAYITLTAKSLGVDSCIIGWINRTKLKEAVGYSDEENCNIVVALGYADCSLREKSRKQIDNIAKYIK